MMLMRIDSFAKSLRPFLASLMLIALAATGGAANAYRAQSSSSEPLEVSFVLTRQPEDPKRYNLVISDSEEHVVSGIFSMDQLQILRTIMVEAEKFSLTEESAGAKEPITTRFMDKQEQSFIVDVQKIGTRSLFFLTLSTDTGVRTWEAGKMIRTTRREDGFFFDLLSRLEAILPKLPAK